MKKIICLISTLLFIGFSSFSPCFAENSYECWGGFSQNDGVYTNVNTDKKLIALTFDDGPHPFYTKQILDILKKHSVKATFFVIGENACYYNKLLQRASSEGHEIGNHTYSHLSSKNCSYKELLDELEKTDKIIRHFTNKKPVLFRPPTGFCNANTIKAAEKMGYKIIIWDVDTRDWAHTPVSVINSNIRQNSKNGSIILMHDFVSKPSPTPEALQNAIIFLKSQGYKFVTVSELLNAK